MFRVRLVLIGVVSVALLGGFSRLRLKAVSGGTHPCE
jgi:hypothetical protein